MRLCVERHGEGFEQVARDDLALERRIDLRGRLGLVAEVGEEAGLAVGADEREPAAAGVAGHVAQVRRAVDDQRVEALSRDQLAQALQARRAHPSSSLRKPHERLAVALDALPR